MPKKPRPIPAYGGLSSADYAELGLMAGLEVHQQLKTARKLFCRCPVGPYRKDFDAEILRHMRPTLSEMGEYDGTALMEKKTRKEIVYQITGDTTCTYEMDDSPPFRINEEALDTAIELSLLYGLGLVGEVQIARKQYLDGSIPTGFQRTAIVGLTGRIPFRGREIGIRQLSIEEDSCREIRDEGHLRVFRTDRLSRPLTETVTEPDMKTPEEVAAVCALIARIAQSTGKVHRGLGSAREDVNVSVAGGTRIEIKGVPRIPLIPALVHFEAFRQRALLDIAEALAERGLDADSLVASRHPLADLEGGVPVVPFLYRLDSTLDAAIVRLPGFRGILGWPVGPTRAFADELSDVVRVVACIDRLPNLYTDDLPERGILPAGFWDRARSTVGAAEADALLLLWGPPTDLETAIAEVLDRCREAFRGVPPETRQRLATGETRFERVLPGPDRMYPDTDLPPLAVDDDRIERIRAGIPEPFWEREARLAAEGVPACQTTELAASPRYGRYRRAVDEHGVSPRDAARVLVSEARAFARRRQDLDRIGETEWEGFFGRYGAGTFAREAIPDVLRSMLEGLPAAAAVERHVPSRAAPEDVAEVVAAAIGLAPEIADPARRERHLMGRAMAKLRGRADGSAVLAAFRGAAVRGDRK